MAGSGKARDGMSIALPFFPVITTVPSTSSTLRISAQGVEPENLPTVVLQPDSPISRWRSEDLNFTCGQIGKITVHESVQSSAAPANDPNGKEVAPAALEITTAAATPINTWYRQSPAGFAQARQYQRQTSRR